MADQKFILPYQKQPLLAFLDRLPQGQKWRVTVGLHKPKRSLDQNAISHAWYLQISREQQEYTPETVKRICKLDYGIPILRGDSPEFNAFCKKTIDALNLREDKVDAMQYIDVTSLMKTSQFSEYLTTLQRVYSGKVDLRFPNEPPMDAAA